MLNSSDYAKNYASTIGKSLPPATYFLLAVLTFAFLLNEDTGEFEASDDSIVFKKDSYRISILFFLSIAHIKNRSLLRKAVHLIL